MARVIFPLKNYRLIKLNELIEANALYIYKLWLDVVPAPPPREVPVDAKIMAAVARAIAIK